MSREKDSTIVYELVTSKYKIAERNRVAKLRFLNEMKNGSSVKRRDSEPSMANAEKTEVTRADISVPGTPVSSRYIETLRLIKRKNHFESDSETDNEDHEGVAIAFKPSKKQSELEEGLKKFTADMEKLHDDVSHDPLRKYFEDSDKKKTYRRDFSEVVSEFPITKSEPETVKKVEQYFEESARLKSFKRDFTEVVQTFDPRNPSGRDEFTDLKKIGTPISSRLIAVERLSSASKNGSVSDKNSQVQLSSNGIHSNSNDFIAQESAECVGKMNGHSLRLVECIAIDILPKVVEEVEIPNESVAQHPAPLLEVPEPNVPEAATVKSEVISAATTEVASTTKSDEASLTKLVIPSAQEVTEEGQREPPVQQASSPDADIQPPPKPARSVPLQVEEKLQSERPNRSGRSDSTASNISVPGTPVSSRELPSLRNRNNIDTDDSSSEDEEEGTMTKEGKEIKLLARTFVNEIENLVQKSFEDDDRQEIVLGELKKITRVEEEKPKAQNIESDEKLIIQEEHHDEFNPDGSGNKVEDYFEKSKKENKYTRTFSEVESFNEVSADVKEKVENYFRDSEQKKSFKRPFSQAINYVEPKLDIEQLLKPGTPISSAMFVKKQIQPESRESDFEVDPEELKAEQAFKKAHDALHGEKKEKLSVDDYFKQSQDRNTYRRDFSEVLEEFGTVVERKNPNVEKYFEQSDAQKSFQRTFSEVIQDLPQRIDDILKVDEKVEKKEPPTNYQRSSRASSVSSTGSLDSESGLPKKSRKHGKKYGIDKYFAASLYRTAYHRSNSRRQSKDNEHDNESLKIVEDEDVFGETQILRQHEFQHDDETRVTQDNNEVNENQTVNFWRDFLKPYNLNLQTEIKLTKEEFLNNRTLE